ncbi:MAG: hypothetical protein ING09_15040 [Roseomonas sp.]|jgi:hypothetical protein|nr:hypothetical protein [Roseomonas sp.]MCA3291501.1 hypothetical protein [Roseomonas sp.]MCA3296165.1 hypothetical protein [Roseomonas sp.]MCA3298590.1 hypothetical protein [Roseomonas sp.]
MADPAAHEVVAICRTPDARDRTLFGPDHLCGVAASRITSTISGTADLPAECVLACEPLVLPAGLRLLPRTIAVRWGLNHAPLSNMVGSIAAADRQRLSQAGSFARVESSLITSRVAQQREMTFPA